jgi:hypothetical protein
MPEVLRFLRFIGPIRVYPCDPCPISGFSKCAIVIVFFQLIFGGWLALTGCFRRTSYWLKGLWAASTLVVTLILTGTMDRIYQEFGWTICAWFRIVPLVVYIPVALVGASLAVKVFIMERNAQSK